MTPASHKIKSGFKNTMSFNSAPLLEGIKKKSPLETLTLTKVIQPLDIITQFIVLIVNN